MAWSEPAARRGPCMIDHSREATASAEGERNRGDRKTLRRFRRSESGATAIEFSIIVLPFLMIIWAVVETGLMFWTNQVLEESLSQASRALVTGESRTRYTSSNPASNLAAFRDDICARAPAGFIDCSKLYVDVQTYSDFSGASSGMAGSKPVASGKLDTSKFSYNQPATNQIVVVRAVLDYKLFLNAWASEGLADLDGGRRAIVASMVFRAEPFV